MYKIYKAEDIVKPIFLDGSEAKITQAAGGSHGLAIDIGRAYSAGFTPGANWVVGNWNAGDTGGGWIRTITNNKLGLSFWFLHSTPDGYYNAKAKPEDQNKPSGWVSTEREVFGWLGDTTGTDVAHIHFEAREGVKVEHGTGRFIERGTIANPSKYLEMWDLVETAPDCQQTIETQKAYIESQAKQIEALSAKLDSIQQISKY